MSTTWLLSAYSEEDKLICSEILVSDDTFVMLVFCNDQKVRDSGYQSLGPVRGQSHQSRYN